MTIQLSLNYKDLQTFIAYINELCEAFNKAGTHVRIKPVDKALFKCYLGEMLVLLNKLNIKQFGWDITKRKKLKRFNFSYTQAYILWQNYNRNNTNHIYINDKIELFTKQLTS